MDAFATLIREDTNQVHNTPRINTLGSNIKASPPPSQPSSTQTPLPKSEASRTEARDFLVEYPKHNGWQAKPGDRFGWEVSTNTNDSSLVTTNKTPSPTETLQTEHP